MEEIREDYAVHVEKEDQENGPIEFKPAGASAMTWSSTYVLLVLLILHIKFLCADLDS